MALTRDQTTDPADGLGFLGIEFTLHSSFLFANGLFSFSWLEGREFLGFLQLHWEIRE